MNLTLSHLERYIAFLHKVEQTKRFAFRPGEQTPANTAEHTFELVMFCWYIMSTEKLELNREKVMMYALAHDVIEAYAGDTPANDSKGQETKASREHIALVRIKEEFREFPELAAAIEVYESKSDDEARFVYAVDKLIDPLGMSLETVHTHWKDKGTTYSFLRQYKDAKIATVPLIQSYWEKLCAKFEKNLSFYFAPERD